MAFKMNLRQMVITFLIGTIFMLIAGAILGALFGVFWDPIITL